MQYSSSFAAFLAASLALADLAAASPASFRQHGPVTSGRRGVSVKQVRNAKHKSKHGATALEKAYLKYNSSVPDDLSSAVSRIRSELAALFDALDIDIDLDAGRRHRRDSGSAVASPEQYDIEYLTPVEFGNPPQTLNLDFDTGSSDLWVYSSETPASEVSGQEVYDPYASNTSAKQSGLSWSISYGDGSTSKGDVYYDTVSVGGLAVHDMAVEVATEVSSEFTADSEIDGLLGLAFGSLNTVSPTRQKTFFDRAASTLDANVFTADLKAGKPGTYNFGYIDNASYTGDIFYTPVESETGYWMFNTTGYQIGNASFEMSQIRGIADTGTTLLMLPVAIVKEYYAAVDGSGYDNSQGGYTFPCDAALPDFQLGVGDGTFTIPGEYVNYAPVDSANSSCYGGIQDDSGIGFAIFGDVALKAAFVVFEGGDSPRLGWAAKDL